MSSCHSKGRAEKLGDVQDHVADDLPDKALQLAQKVEVEVSAFSDVVLNQKGHVLHRKVALGRLDHRAHTRPLNRSSTTLLAATSN
jgi:hypothetical protein